MKKPTITSTWEDITPPMAEEYLLANRKNRPPKRHAISMYARDMQGGNWRLTHQGIAFDENGDLIDGQNRLHAIVKSECTVRMMVTRGLPVEQGKKKTMDAVDQGVSRSVADQLRLSHDARGRVSLLVATSARIVALVFGPAIGKISTPQCVEMQSFYGEHIEAVLLSMERAAIKPLLRAPVLGGLAFARAAFPNQIDSFMDELIKEKGGAAKHPARELHDAILQKSLSDANPYSSIDRRIESLDVMAVCQRFIDPKSTDDSFTFFSAGQTELIAGLQKIFFAEPLKKKVTTPTPIPRLTATAEIQISPAHGADPKPVEAVLPEDVSEEQALDEFMKAMGSIMFTKEQKVALEARWRRIQKRNEEAAAA